jgi:hypothetical protein
MAKRRFTAELLAQYQRGVNKVVCSLAPHEGEEVEYSPRSKHDAEPWVLPGAPYRLSGRECHILTPRFQVVDRGNAFAVVDSRTGTDLLLIRSRYAAEDTASRYEADPSAAMELEDRRADEIRVGDFVLAPWRHLEVDVVTEVFEEFGLIFLTTDNQTETPYEKDDRFTVGTLRKAEES